MWGGTPDRNMVSNMKGLPTEWDIKTKKNVKWVAKLGSQAYGNPVVADGKVRGRGKAWPTGQPEPDAWTIEKVDPIGNHKGAPGFFIDAEFGAYIDNIKVARNQ